MNQQINNYTLKPFGYQLMSRELEKQFKLLVETPHGNNIKEFY